MNVNLCSCCKEIWNGTNLNSINFSNHKLYLCPGCYKEYESILKRAYTDGQKNLSKKFKDWLHG